MDELAARFHALFRGSPYARGVSTCKPKTSGDKTPGGTTAHEPVSVEHWITHLAGRKGLGVIPATDTGRSWFGAVDLDDYKMDKAAIVHKVYDLDIGAIPCNSKSGGLHVYFFFDGSPRTCEVQAFLEHVAGILGYPNAEIFPKQAESKVNQVGNWINMPYYGTSDRWGLWAKDMSPMNATDFLDSAENMKQSAARLYTNNVKLAVGGPKCITDVFRNGTVYGDGVRHEIRKKYIAYLMDKDIEDKEEACMWFANLATPGDPQEDVEELIRGWENHGFKFTCFLGKCEEKCGQKKDGPTGPTDLDGVPKVTIYMTTPRIYIIKYDDKPAVKLGQADILVREKVKNACLGVWDSVPKMPPAKDWDRLINEWLDKAERITPPESSSITGELAAHVETYCRGGCSAKDPSRKRSWIVDDRHVFTVAGLMSYLESVRFKAMERHQVSCWLFQRDAEAGAARVNGRELETLSLPLYPGASYTPPAKEAEEIV